MRISSATKTATLGGNSRTKCTVHLSTHPVEASMLSLQWGQNSPNSSLSHLYWRLVMKIYHTPRERWKVGKRRRLPSFSNTLEQNREAEELSRAHIWHLSRTETALTQKYILNFFFLHEPYVFSLALCCGFSGAGSKRGGLGWLCWGARDQELEMLWLCLSHSSLTMDVWE